MVRGRGRGRGQVQGAFTLKVPHLGIPNRAFLWANRREMAQSRMPEQDASMAATAPEGTAIVALGGAAMPSAMALGAVAQAQGGQAGHQH